MALSQKLAMARGSAQSTLTVEIGAAKTTYAFNGGETQQTFPPPPTIAGNDPTKVLWMYREASSSRAAWIGDRLVIVTHHLNRVNVPSRPSQFDSQITIRSVLAREGPDRLVVERITIADPDFDVPAWVDLPISVKTTYRKAQ